MKRGTPDHPKTSELMAALDVPRWQAVGILESLWLWTARYAPQGDIGKWTDEAIAQGIDWREDPARLITGLVQARFLDRDAPHRLIVHHWPEHCDQTCKRYLANHDLDFVEPDASTVLASAEDDASLPVAAPVPVAAPAPRGRKRQQRASTNSTPFAELASQWNEVCGEAGLPKVRDPKKVGERLKPRIRTRWQDADFRKHYSDVLTRIAGSSFCRGEGDNGWRADFAWLFGTNKHGQDNWQNVLAGKYDDGNAESSGEATLARLKRKGLL